MRNEVKDLKSREENLKNEIKDLKMLKSNHEKLKEDHNKHEKQGRKTEIINKSLNDQACKEEISPKPTIKITPEIKRILMLMDNQITTETTEQEILNATWLHLEKLQSQEI